MPPVCIAKFEIPGYAFVVSVTQFITSRYYGFQWPQKVMFMGMDTFHDTRATDRRSVVTSVATRGPTTNQVRSGVAFQPQGKEINENAHKMTGSKIIKPNIIHSNACIVQCLHLVSTDLAPYASGI